MAAKVFINYRRDDSIGMAGRLHDRLAQTFGRDKLFMDVDHIPAGADFVEHLNSQVAACDVVLVVIGPHWLKAKDKAGQRRLHQPGDLVAIEIATALSRNIRVIPVLVDGARMPTESELPDSLKALARRQAADVRHAHFGRDADALIARMGEALDGVSGERPSWRGTVVAGTVVLVAVLLAGGFGYSWMSTPKPVVSLTPWLDAATGKNTTSFFKEAVADKRGAEEAEQQQAALKAEIDNTINQGKAAERTRDWDTAVAKFSEVIRLDPKNANAFSNRGLAYWRKGNTDGAIADYDEAIGLDPRNASAFNNRGLAYGHKGDQDRAIADYDEAIRLNPKLDMAFNNRGFAYWKKGNTDQAIADYDEAIRLNPKQDMAFNNRGLVYANNGDQDRAIANYDEAIRLNPNYALALCNRGNAKLKIGDMSGNADIAKARQLDASAC